MFDEGDEDPVLSDKNASPLFCPPEACDTLAKQLKGRAVDIWALGVTLFCFVHGSFPFEDSNIIDLYKKIFSDEPLISDKLSSEVKDLLQKMLRKNPAERIGLTEIKSHPWVTSNGDSPLLSTEDNCVFEDVTEEEVEHAVRPAIMFFSKVSHFLENLKANNPRN